MTSLMKEAGSLRLVTIPEKPSFEELKRAKDLSKPYINLNAVHINRIIPKKYHRCEFCKQMREIQNKYIQAIESEFSEIQIWKSHMLKKEPLGMKGLKKLGDEIFGNRISADEILHPDLYRSNPKFR